MLQDTGIDMSQLYLPCKLDVAKFGTPESTPEPLSFGIYSGTYIVLELYNNTHKIGLEDDLKSFAAVTQTYLNE